MSKKKVERTNPVMVGKEVLCRIVADNTELSVKTAHVAVGAILDAIVNEVGKGNTVMLRGFGSFKQKKRAARTGRNPQTGEPMEIPASNRLSFRSPVLY